MLIANRDGGIALGTPFEMDGFIQVFFVIAGLAILFQVGKSLTQTVENLGEQEIARTARVVSKRIKVSGGGGTGDHHSSGRTTYFVTFQFADGSRQELTVSGEEYGLLAEGDQGLLRSQGTWYRGFDRQRSSG